MTRYRIALIAVLLSLCGCSDRPAAPVDPAALPVGLTRGPLNWVDVADEAGLDLIPLAGSPTVDHIIDSVGPGAAWLDYDSDGDADLYLAQGADRQRPTNGPPDQMLRNDGGRFTEVTAESGLGDTLWSFGVAVADYDNDGDADIYLSNWGPNRLYRNDGDGRFTDVGDAAGVAGKDWSTTAAWSDVDRDGDLDLYVANYVEFDFERYPARGETRRGGAPPCIWKGLEVFCGPRNLIPAPDRFFRNDGDPDGDGVPNFVERTDQAGLAHGNGYFALDARFFDSDGDGDSDLYVANDSVRNSFFVNDGTGHFDETAIFAGLAYNEQGIEQAGMGIGVADYDGDEDLDLAVANFSHDHDTVYRNEGDGFFSDASYSAEIGNVSFFTLAWGVSFVDIDQDGWEDLYIAHGHVYPQVDGRGLGTDFRQQNGLYRNLSDGRFEDLSNSGGPGMQSIKSSRGVLPVDLDADGDLDLLITNLGDRPDLLRNDSVGGNWLQIRLEGQASNRDGVGARIVLTCAGRRQVREITRSSSFSGSTLPVAHFGLGPAETIESLEVLWPSGSTTIRRDLEPNRLHRIPEGS